MSVKHMLASKFKSFIKRCAKDFALGWYLPRVYREGAKEPLVKERVLFLETKEIEFPDSFKVLYQHLEENYRFELEYVTLKQNRVGFVQYYKNCIGFAKKASTAAYVFLCDASDVVSCLPLRDETKVVQLWHACGAFKKWGMSTADLKFGGSRKQLLRHPFYKNLSLVTVSSSEVAWAYAEAMVLEDKREIIRPLGVSRTDLFFDGAFLEEARSVVEEAVPLSRGKKTILYAPTFRGRVASAQGPDQLDVEAFRKAFGRDYVLLIKHHPFVKSPPSIPDGCDEFAFDVSFDLPIDQLLSVADICISDYSSLVFEYSLFGRPMLFFAYDREDYSDWRGFYYDYDELTPGPVFTDNASMIEYIEHIDERFDRVRVDVFREKFMSSCDGSATLRICDSVFGDELVRLRKRKASEVLSEADPAGFDISIVIPAFNAMPEFKRTLASIAGQTYDHARMEIVVTDDCSTDGTWEELCGFAEGHPGLTVVSERLERPSGSPSQPRNVGLGKARGRYVFFLDADDWLGDRAVEKMLDHAVEWGSDVLYVKMKGENGREVPQAMFACNQPEADLYGSKVLWSLAPLKLFKRTLIEDLTFPEFMPEDISFTLRACCRANKVSVAADYDYYHVSWRGDECHASASTWDNVESNLQAYEDIFKFTAASVPESRRDEVLMRRLFRRDVYRTLMTIVGEPLEPSKRHYDRLTKMAGPFYREGMYLTCPVAERLVLDAAFFGSLECVKEVVRKLQDGRTISCAIAEGRLLYELEGEGDRPLSVDVTEAVRLDCAVERMEIAEGEGHLKAKGSTGVEGFSQDLENRLSVQLVLRSEKGASEVCEPCLISAVEYAGSFDSIIHWECDVDLTHALEMKTLPGKFHLFLRIGQESFFKEVRIGKQMLGQTAKREFLSSFGRIGGYGITPYLTEHDNFSLRFKEQK